MLNGFNTVTSTIGDGGLRIALSKLIRHALFSGDPNVFLNGKSMIGRIPSGITLPPIAPLATRPSTRSAHGPISAYRIHRESLNRGRHRFQSGILGSRPGGA